jgi:hypothetical protein
LEREAAAVWYGTCPLLASKPVRLFLPTAVFSFIFLQKSSLEEKLEQFGGSPA